LTEYVKEDKDINSNRNHAASRTQQDVPRREIVANHKSAIKRHKQSVKRAARNRTVKTRIKNVVKSVRAAIKADDQAAATQLLSTATSSLDKAATKGVIHWKKAARKISRLAKALNAAKAAA
jgi:small subunit ribosomal protein S20